MKKNLWVTLQASLQTFKPPPRLTVSSWADSNRVLSQESAAESGKWNTDRAPYQKEMMDALHERGIEKIVFMTSSQVGKTSILENILGFFISHDPSPMLMVMPTLSMAQSFSKDRLMPLFRDTPALHGKGQTERTRDGTNTILHKTFPGGQLTLSGANSPASLASRPIRILLCDEISRWPKSSGTEGSPLHLAQKRTTAFHNRKMVYASTPGIQGECLIASEWEISDKRFFQVPCPHCSSFQSLEWKQIQWQRDENGRPRLDTVVYRCMKCLKEITDPQKMRMLKHGHWVKENPNAKGIAGFHLNELYSPWRKWCEVVSDFWEAKDHPEKLKVWTNTSLGLPFQYTSQDQPDWRRLYERRESFRLIPAKAKLLTAGVDIQRDRIEMSLIAWSRKESWVISHEVYPGDTFNLDDPCWRTLEQKLFQNYETEDGQSILIRRMAIDAGYNTSTVYAWTTKMPRHLAMAIKGQDLDVPLATPKKTALTALGRGNKRGPLLWRVGSNVLKADLYGRLAIQKPTCEELKKSGSPSQFVHFSELPEGYFKQLCGEACILTTDASGKPRYQWKQIYPNVEALDCFVYAMAAYVALRADRWNEEMWKKF